MKTLHRLSQMGFLAGLLWSGFALAARSAETNPPPAAAATTNAVAESDEAQKAFVASLRLQEQLHANLLAIEQARVEAAAAARINADALAARLEQIERSLTTQRERELHAAQSSTRAMLIASGVLAGVGMLALLVTAWFQLRGLSRLAEIAAHAPAGRALAPLGADETRFSSAEGNGERLLGVIDRLERRIHELENAPRLALSTGGRGNGSSPRLVTPVSANGAHSEDAEPPALLLGKGQVLMSLGQMEQALACFDAVLAREPGHTEALMKKGHALEQLKRLDEALACYDRALVSDPALTQAHLAKGGVFNQLERFNEALECYERALKGQPKAAGE